MIGNFDSSAGLERVLAALHNVVRDGRDVWKADCPVCGGRLTVRWGRNRDTGTHEGWIHCFSEDCPKPSAVAVLSALGLGWADLYAFDRSAPLEFASGPTAGLRRVGRRLPNGNDLRRLHARLARDLRALRWLRDHRGISLATARRLRIGWDGDVYFLPSYRGRQLEQCYRYAPGEQIVAWPGTTRDLYIPGGTLGTSRWVLLCEGEWDTALAWQAGLPAVGRPGAAKRWQEKWTAMLADRDVALAYDTDEVGSEAAERDAHRLHAVGLRVRVVDLGLTAPGKDVTDWFLREQRSAEELRALVSRTAGWSE